MSESLTYRDVLERWQESGRIDEDGRKALVARLRERREDDEDPVYIRALAGIGAWVAAMCFIAFLAILRVLDHDDMSLMGWGVIFLVAAIVLRNLTQRTFPVQLSLAFVSAGNILFVGWGVVNFEDHLGGLGAITMFQAFVCLAMYGPYRDKVYRFLAPLVTLAFATSWVLDEKSVHYLLHFLIAAEFLGVGLILALGLGGRFLSPLGYACACAGPGSIILFTVFPRVAGPVWPTAMLIAAGMIWLYFWAAGGLSAIRFKWLWLAVGATLLLSFFTNPGILAALGLLVLGYARRDPLLLGLGFAFLPTFLVVYYYDLDVDLAYKSYVLAGSGLALLAVRLLASRGSWAGGRRA